MFDPFFQNLIYIHLIPIIQVQLRQPELIRW